MSGVIEGRCNEPGPWGTICTDYPGHRYSHYDGGDDSSWQDDWQEDTPVEGGGTYVDEEEDGNHAQQLQNRHGVPTVLYGKPGCVQCDATERKFLKDGVAFAKVDVSQDPAARDFIKGMGYMKVPVVYTTTAEGDFHWMEFDVIKIARHIKGQEAAA